MTNLTNLIVARIAQSLLTLLRFTGIRNACVAEPMFIPVAVVSVSKKK